MDQDENNFDGLEIEPGRRTVHDDNPFAQDDDSKTMMYEVDKDSIRDEIKMIEKEIESLTNTFSYGDNERINFLESKLDALRVKLLRDDTV